ncbi:hypothetical protein VTN77DRAFT_8353 [Rasamsonia byssochlamydoides]|uniref:uncharacterized protein n=1 Tax=Rasamsonia byssochlamydoides TaxID=89139 RepID=UPI0037431945
MEQSTPQSNVPDVHHSSVGQGSLPPEYWNHIDPLYASGPDPPQLQQQPQQQPLGITWDHPIFTQQQQHQQQQHQQHQQHQQPQQNHFQPQREHNPNIYSAPPQSWHQNSALAQPTMSPGPQNYSLPQQHQYQMPHYPQGQMTYNSPSMNPSNNLSYHSSYSLPNPYYQTTYSQAPHRNIAPRPGPSQQVPIRPNNVQRPLNHQYILPAEYQDGVSHNPVNFSNNNYLDSNPSVSYQQTINPQFLTSPQGATTQSQVEPQNEFLFYNPAASTYERADNAKNYQVYNENVEALPPADQFPSHQLTAQQIPQTQPASSAPTLVPQVVIPVTKEHAPEAPEVAKPEKAAAPRKKKASPTKQAQPKPKKTANKAVSKKADAKSDSSDSDSDSSDDSELEVEAPEEPSPLPPTRPDNPEEAAEYDALKAVWAPRNRRPNVEKIKSALVAFKDVVKSVRDEWKTQSQAMKEAENKSENDKAAELKKKVLLQRRVMDVVVRTTLEKGHPLIVEKLGEHPIAVSALYSFLLDRHQASDYDGVLTVNILKLLAQFTTIDEEVLQKTNVAKLLPRIIKKGSQTVKDLSQKILDNAAASTKRKQESSKATSAKDEPPSKDPASSESTSDTSRPDSLAGTKRPREGESNGLPAAKRTVTPSTVKNGPSAAKPGNGNTAATKRPEGTVEAKPTSSTTAPASARPKANIVAPKPTSLFSSLSSASKKPGTSNAARAAAAAAAKEKATAAAEKKETPPQPLPPKPTFSFGDILADLNKREEASSAKPAENRPPETEEERQKRLRKEARRKLRVSWKPDDSLTEVRLFTHDPEEEIGPNDGLRREDIKGEGRVLKMHKNLDEEDEEEEMGIKEVELHKYEVPSEIDFNDLPDDDRTRNFAKRGGTQQPDSPEKEAQERREATTLMVFYTSPGDIPPSPKEPPPPAEDEPVTEVVAFGQPGDHVKTREARYFAMMNPQPTPASQPTAPPQAAMPSGPLDIANLLKILQKTPQQSTPPPQPVQPAAMSDLERTVNMFRQQQQGPQAQFQMPQVPPPASQPLDLQKILAVINAQKQMQQQPAALPQIPQPQPVAQSQPVIAPNLAAIISQLGSNPQVSQPQAQSQPQPQPQPQPQNHMYEDPDRRRMREGGGRDDDRYSKRPRMYVDPKAKRHPKAGSVPCRYWREGKCLKGEDCTFRHDPLD